LGRTPLKRGLLLRLGRNKLFPWLITLMFSTETIFWRNLREIFINM
jgi:hypothetical protein